MFKKFAVVAALLATPFAAQAATIDFDVDAATNSTTGGVGLATGITLAAGDAFAVTADVADTWSMGATASRTGNADGLPAFGNHSQGGLSARFGTLVAQIGTGDFFVLGTGFSGLAADAGELKLFAFDSNNSDNDGEITASVTVEMPAVPLPASGLMLLAAVGGVAAIRRKKG